MKTPSTTEYRHGWLRRMLLFSYVLWLICLFMPGCSASHDGWAPAAKPLPLGVLIFYSLVATPGALLKLNLWGFIFCLSNWAFLATTICFSHLVKALRWIPFAIAVFLPGYWVFGFQHLVSRSFKGTLYYGFYAAGAAYLVAAIACLGIGVQLRRSRKTARDGCTRVDKENNVESKSGAVV